MLEPVPTTNVRYNSLLLIDRYICKRITIALIHVITSLVFQNIAVMGKEKARMHATTMGYVNHTTNARAIHTITWRIQTVSVSTHNTYYVLVNKC